MIQDQYLQLLKDNSLPNQICEAYLIQKQQIINNLISYFSNIIVYGPIALLNAEQICSTKLSQQYVTVLRKNYEALLCLNEQQDDKKLISQTQDSFKTYFQEQILDYQFLNFLNDLKDNPYIMNLTLNQWLDQIQEFIEISTIQEINQTQVLKEQFESGYQTKERKSIFNYDGDEEKTPQQSEEDEQNKNKVNNIKINISIKKARKIGIFKMKKVVKKVMKLVQQKFRKFYIIYIYNQGQVQKINILNYNSDHKTKQSKMTRRRRKQANNQEFDTDRENKQKV